MRADSGHIQNVAQLLLVEDNPADARLMREALARLPREVVLTVAQDGEQALVRLQPGALLPDLILLDLNLPVMNGHELLQVLKRDTRLQMIPVVVMTTSQADSDVELAYVLGASAYVLKPLQLDVFFQLIAALSTFWLDHVRFASPEVNK